MLHYRTYPTRNYSASQTPMHPRAFVLHTTEGEGMSYLLSLLSGEVGRGDGVRPSVHFLVSLKGEIWELAPWRPGEAFVCWHAGRSEWGGVSGLNRYTLGVEIEHVAGRQYPELQIRAVETLLRTVRAAYGPDYLWQWGLLTHAQIAYPRGRKSDPTAPYERTCRARWTAAWNAATEEDDDMTPEQDARMKRIELSEFARSFDVAVLKALARGDVNAADEAEANKVTAVAAKRKELKL